jgi:cell division protein ZipA
VSELRWILLGAGVALILALWWWEARKARAPSSERSDALTGSERPDQDFDPGDEARVDDPPEFEEHYSPTIERVRVPRRPPLIEIPEDVEVDVSDFIAADRRHAPEPTPRLEPQIELEADVADAANENESQFLQYEPDEHHRPPWINTQPLERDEVAPPRVDEEPEPPFVDPEELRRAEASVQRIVALRLVATGESWNGRQLRGALEAEGMRYGQYAIFHRAREDGRPLLYVASMMEPGSFDIDRMDDQEFSGVSLFGVVPGPLDAPSTFDLALTVGRNLADRMRGQLQDEQGSTLTAQRILNLREELVHFEHRNRRLRRN